MIDKVIIHNNANSKAHAYITRSSEGLEIHEVKRKYDGALYIRVLVPDVDTLNLAVKYAALILDEANGNVHMHGYIHMSNFIPQNVLTFDTSIHEQYWKMEDKDGKSAYNRWLGYFRNDNQELPTPTEESLPFKVRAAVETINIEDLVKQTESAMDEMNKNTDTSPSTPPATQDVQKIPTIVCGRDELWIDKKGNVNVRTEGSSDWVKTIPKFEPNVAP